MAANAGLTAQPLAWVKGEIDRSIESARDALAKTAQRPGERVRLLSTCEDHLRQVRGALQFLGLEGVTRFCAALETTVKGLTSGADKLSRSAFSIVDRGMFALAQFLDDLAKGELNAPLRLFPVYREVAELGGHHEAKESELFFPDMSPAPPNHPQRKQLSPGELAQHTQAARSLFQRSLLLWLQDPSNRQGLKNMRHALDSLDQVAHQLRTPLGLWWAAVGLIDAIMFEQAPGDAKSLLGHLERAMREPAARPFAGAEALMRDILYPLARCKPVSERVREVKAHYRLEEQLPVFCVSGALEYDMEKLAPQIEDMKKRLAEIEACWVEYTSGGKDAAKKLREQATGLRTLIADQGHYRLVKLLDVIILIASKLPDPHPGQNELLAFEMAAVFLFMENMLDSLTSPPADIDQQVTVMVGWLLDAMKPRAKAASRPSGLRDDITQRQNLAQIRAQVAREIIANMQQVEQIVDAVARNPTDREGLASLSSNLHQMSGALTLLDLPRAKLVLSACEHLVKLAVSADLSFLKVYLEFIADGLSCLGFYLEALQRGQPPSDELLLGFLERIGPREALAEAPAPPAHAQPAPANPAAPDRAPAVAEPLQPSAEEAAPAIEAEAPQVEPVVATQSTPSLAAEAPAGETSAAANDAQELLNVYIEEAAEVVADVAAQLARLRAVPEDRNALIGIRRDFHTLKGSGRMVGLNELGEIAWEIEQTLNEWLRESRPPGPAVVELIERAHAAFARWLDELRAGVDLSPEAQPELVALARAARSVEPPPVAAATPQGTPELEIGDVRLTTALYEIYLREAFTHLATLNAEFAQWSAHPGYAVSHEFARAAHTLKSSSRTTGFTAVAELSDALEQWLRYLSSEAQVLRPIEPVGRAIRALENLVGEVEHGRAPLSAHAELLALQELMREADSAQRQPPLPAPEAAAPAASEAVEVPREEVHDDLDPQFLPDFLEEAGQLLPGISAELRSLRERPDNDGAYDSLARALHTLKGSARMAGAMRVGEMTHNIELRMQSAGAQGQADAEFFAAMEGDLDRVAQSIDSLTSAAAPRAESEPAATAAAPAAPPPALPGVTSTLRVDADTVDRLVNQIGEISIARSRIDGEMDGFKQSLLDLTDSVTRLRNHLRETQLQADSQLQSRLTDIERDERQFDPLEFDRYTRLQELTRLMAESLHDIATAQQTLLGNLGETEAALSLQGRVNRDLQQDLLGLRSVPLSLLSERLYRTVRQTARELGRSANLEIVGEAIEVDRNVLQRIAAPLEHMLRNAIAHGIESPEARRAAGKPEAGHIRLSLAQEGNEYLLTLEDDGGGINRDAIQLEALRMGLLHPGEEVGEARLLQMIFAPGFSTAGEITETSGHGIGMDVVRSEVAAIGGRVEVHSSPGQGARFRVYFPATLGASQAIVVRAGGETYAVPSTLVEQVYEAKLDELEARYASGKAEWQGAEYPFYYLPRLLGRSEAVAEIKRHNSVLLLRSGESRAAIHVDQIVKNQEIVVKSAGPQLARVPGIAGATVLGNGQVVLIVNPIPLTIRAQQTGALPQATVTRLATEESLLPQVMVVDDSLTVRRLTSRLLSRAGYEVAVAKDGVDALQQMQEGLPDLLLADIEMPRMDGLELVKKLRADPRSVDLPIIIITSRIAEKHRRHAFELGANAFFGKPYQEDELLAKVAELLGREPRAAAV
jgi:chemosensory pili system protein ChpA (sensor histidine kinase/response regulator)